MRSLVFVGCLLAGCSAPAASRDPAPSSSAAWSTPAATPSPARHDDAPPASASTAPLVASAATTPAPASAGASASTAPHEEAPVPHVKVVHIGMHIGGDADVNSDANKAPIRESVAPHFDELRRCWGKLGDEKAKGDFGVDLLIPREGGKPKKVDNVRSTLKSAAFRECAVGVFEQIDFKKPRTGLTKVSYSLRFGG